MQTALNDLRCALRGLRRTPAFAAGAIVVLGVSIGVNLAVFTVAKTGDWTTNSIESLDLSTGSIMATFR